MTERGWRDDRAHDGGALGPAGGAGLLGSPGCARGPRGCQRRLRHAVLVQPRRRAWRCRPNPKTTAVHPECRVGRSRLTRAPRTTRRTLRPPWPRCCLGCQGCMRLCPPDAPRAGCLPRFRVGACHHRWDQRHPRRPHRPHLCGRLQPGWPTAWARPRPALAGWRGWPIRPALRCQGGALTLQSVLRYPRRLGGGIVFSGWLTLSEASQATPARLARFALGSCRCDPIALPLPPRQRARRRCLR